MAMTVPRARQDSDSAGPNSAGRNRRNWPQLLHEACRLIELQAPPLTELARRLRVGRAELQRQFVLRLGTSPKAYAQALALFRLARGAGGERNALAAAFEAGFASSSVAYENSRRALGVTPGGLRRELSVGWWLGLSDLGWMLLAATERGICWLAFGEQPGPLMQALRTAFPKATLRNDEARLYRWFEQVREFILLPKAALELPIDIQGTAFQSRVWRALRRIPLGATTTYGELAQQLGEPRAVRAVASACARNRVALIVPCHRVVAADGSLAGYRWGVDRKRQLLERESR